MPPLLIGTGHVDEAVELLEQSLDEVLAEGRPAVDRGVAAV
jgi:hypothetical protein